MPKQKNNDGNTKEAIFLTAIEMFSKNGYDGTSVRDISYKVGIKESSFYSHYKSKNELLESIFEWFDNWLKASKPSDEQLDSIIRTISPVEFFENIFLGIGTKHNEFSQKIALLIMYEQYKNEKAKIFSLEKNCREMALFFENVLNKYKSIKCLPDTFDSSFFSHELNYYFLGMVNEWSHVKLSKEDDNYLVERLKKHLQFIFSTKFNEIK